MALETAEEFANRVNGLMREKLGYSNQEPELALQTKARDNAVRLALFAEIRAAADVDSRDGCCERAHALQSGFEKVEGKYAAKEPG